MVGKSSWQKSVLLVLYEGTDRMFSLPLGSANQGARPIIRGWNCIMLALVS